MIPLDHDSSVAVNFIIILNCLQNSLLHSLPLSTNCYVAIKAILIVRKYLESFLISVFESSMFAFTIIKPVQKPNFGFSNILTFSTHLILQSQFKGSHLILKFSPQTSI